MSKNAKLQKGYNRKNDKLSFNAKSVSDLPANSLQALFMEDDETIFKVLKK